MMDREDTKDVIALVKELQAAREVVEIARRYLGPVGDGFHYEECTPDYVDEPADCVPECPEPKLAAAITAYDALKSGASPADTESPDPTN